MEKNAVHVPHDGCRLRASSIPWIIELLFSLCNLPLGLLAFEEAFQDGDDLFQ